MGIIKEQCSKCGKLVLPGSLYRCKNTSMRICAFCKTNSELVEKRVADTLGQIITILYPLS